MTCYLIIDKVFWNNLVHKKLLSIDSAFEFQIIF